MTESGTCAAVQLGQNDEQEREAQEPGHGGGVGGGRLVSDRSGPDPDIYTPMLWSPPAAGELTGQSWQV